MNDILYILLFIVMLGVLVTIHELGHFTMAKLFNVYVSEFAVGFGPVLFKKKKGETQYAVRIIPLGGYVAMYGEGAELPDGVVVDESRSLLKIKRWKRAIIMSAGIIMNFTLAFVIFFISNFALMQTQVTTQMKVEAGSIAETSGIANDEWLYFEDLEIDGYRLQVYDDEVIIGEQSYVVVLPISSYKDLNLSKDITLLKTGTYGASKDDLYTPVEGSTFVFDMTVRNYTDRENNVYTERVVPVTISAVEGETEGTFVWQDIGIDFSSYQYRHSFGVAIQESGKDWWTSASAITRFLVGLFQGQGFESIAGPIGVYAQTASAIENYGLGIYLYYWGFISVNLALFNLLPFPGLDGWHLLVVIIESITRKEINPKIKNAVATIGIMLLFGLMIFITFRDIVTQFF